jgi:hypothetical protein
MIYSTLGKHTKYYTIDAVLAFSSLMFAREMIHTGFIIDCLTFFFLQFYVSLTIILLFSVKSSTVSNFFPSHNGGYLRFLTLY